MKKNSVPGPPVPESLESYGIHRKRGFLPSPDPLDCLPEEFAAWEALGQDLPKLLIAGKARDAVNRLLLLDASRLPDERSRQRAMVLLSFLGHAYVWGEEQTVNSIPAGLAVPWVQLARSLGRPPVLSYASYVLDNWRRLDANRSIELGNICMRQNFLGGQDEEWFVLVHVAIEAQAGPALAAMIGAQQAVAADRPELLADQLTLVADALAAMHRILLRMPERCDPYIYFNRVRPYIHGWANHPRLPEGMLYQGVADYGGRPQSFRGETGAQSSIIPCCDALLGITHAQDTLHAYLLEMRDYMPPGHRRFIEAVENGPSVRAYVLRHKRRSQLRDTYNAAIDCIERFRSTHLQYAYSYIVQQSAATGRNPNDVGTGGTPFGPYLKKHRDETSRHRIE